VEIGIQFASGLPLFYQGSPVPPLNQKIKIFDRKERHVTIKSPRDMRSCDIVSNNLVWLAGA